MNRPESWTALALRLLAEALLELRLQAPTDDVGQTGGVRLPGTPSAYWVADVAHNLPAAITGGEDRVRRELLGLFDLLQDGEHPDPRMADWLLGRAAAGGWRPEHFTAHGQDR